MWRNCEMKQVQVLYMKKSNTEVGSIRPLGEISLSKFELSKC